MKISRLIAVSFISVGMIATLIAQDETLDQTSKAVDTQERLKRFLKKYPDSDLNKDGALTRDEVQQYNKNRKSDQNGDARPTR